MTYRHTPEMGEISGMGGDYEKLCQDMLEAGVSWMLGHPAFEFDAEGFQNVVGIIYPNNEDTQELMRTIIHVSGEQATGAQVHAVMVRLSFIHAEGWHDYVEECIETQRRKMLQ